MIHTIILLLLVVTQRLFAFQALEPGDIGTVFDNTDSICLDMSWPSANVGTRLVPQAPNAELQQMLTEVDPRRIKTIIEKLVSFGTRHTFSTQTDPNRGIGAARDWIASEMRNFAAASEGRMSVDVQAYTQGRGGRVPFPVQISNVVARLEGITDPERVYVSEYISQCSSTIDDADGEQSVDTMIQELLISPTILLTLLERTMMPQGLR